MDGGRAQIRDLIVRLRDVDATQCGLSLVVGGWCDAVDEELEELLVGQLPARTGRNDPIAELVRFGPAAVPELIKALKDQSSSRLTLRSDSVEILMQSDLPVNPLNPLEAALLDAPQSIARALTTRRGLDAAKATPREAYRVTVGDLAFLVIGQIVNRPYAVASYQPSGFGVVTSQGSDPRIAEAVALMWAADDSDSLLRSLLIDLETDCCAGLQSGAAIRLLRYFPEDASKALGPVLGSFGDGTGSRTGSDVPERTRAVSLRSRDKGRLIRACGMLGNVAVMDAVHRLAMITRPEDGLEDCLTVKMLRTYPESLAARAREFVLNPRVYAAMGPYGSSSRILRRLRDGLPDVGRETLTQVADFEPVECRRALIVACETDAGTEDWVVDILVRLLDDRRPTELKRRTNSGESSVRVCDLAMGELLATVSTDSLGESFAALSADDQIERVRAALKRPSEEK